jgi:uncharacterized protein
MSQSQEPTPPTGPGNAFDYSPVTSVAGYDGPPPTKDECNMAVLIYVLSIFTGFIGPLIIWLLKKDSSKFIDHQGKEVLNWCITFVLGYIVSFILMFVLIGFLMMIALLVAAIVFAILGAMKVSKGIPYRYPFAIRLLK